MQVRHNAFSENLGTDWLAVDQDGAILTRASTREAAEQAAPGAMYMTGADIESLDQGATADPIGADAAVIGKMLDEHDDAVKAAFPPAKEKPETIAPANRKRKPIK